MSPPETRRGGPPAAPSESIVHQRDDLNTASAQITQASAAFIAALARAWQPDPDLSCGAPAARVAP